MVSEDDRSYELITKLLAKRAKQRYDKLGTVRYILRLLMVCTRIGMKPFFMSDIMFALFGYLENAIGMAKLFNLKKQMIRLSHYNHARQMYEIRKQEQRKADRNAKQFESKDGDGGTGTSIYPSLLRGNKRSFLESNTSIAEEEHSDDGLNYSTNRRSSGVQDQNFLQYEEVSDDQIKVSDVDDSGLG